MADDATGRRGGNSGAGMETTGFRVLPATRRALVQAAAFTDARSVLAVIESAVSEYLARLEKDVDGFAAACAAAERAVARRGRRRRS